MKKLFILILVSCIALSSNAITCSELAKIYQDKVFKPYILEKIPGSYIAAENEYGNSYTVTYSYNPSLDNGWYILLPH